MAEPSIVSVAEISIAMATGILAFFTYRLANETHKTTQEAKAASFRQIGVQTWLDLEKRFDSTEMKAARRNLAAIMMRYKPHDHDGVSETVLNFFESVGIAYKTGYLDKELTESSFSFYACRWLEILKPYIEEERKRHNNDTSIYKDFSDFAKAMLKPKEIIDSNELRRFLADEGVYPKSPSGIWTNALRTAGNLHLCSALSA